MAQVEFKPFIPYDYESLTVGSAVVSLTSSKFASLASLSLRAFITLESAPIRFRIDGAGNPTATEGHLLETNQNLMLEGYECLNQFRAIRTTGVDGILKITYEKQ